MHHAKRNCCKIKSGRIPFSPEASLWIKRTLCYRSLLRYWAGKIRKKGNLLRQACRCRIGDPLSLSIQTIQDRLRECKALCKYFTKHGHKHQRSDLTSRLHDARDRQYGEAEHRILQIIQGKHDHSFWRRPDWALGKHQCCSVRNVQVEDQDCAITEFTMQSEVQQLIWDKIHRERYHLAKEAPICQGRLRGEFGYNTSTPSGEVVLDGSYILPPGSHEGTQRLIQSIACIWSKIPSNSVRQIINRHDWQYMWKHNTQ